MCGNQSARKLQQFMTKFKIRKELLVREDLVPLHYHKALYPKGVKIAVGEVQPILATTGYLDIYSSMQTTEDPQIH